MIWAAVESDMAKWFIYMFFCLNELKTDYNSIHIYWWKLYTVLHVCHCRGCSSFKCDTRSSCALCSLLILLLWTKSRYRPTYNNNNRAKGFQEEMLSVYERLCEDLGGLGRHFHVTYGVFWSSWAAAAADPQDCWLGLRKQQHLSVKASKSRWFW